MVARKVGLAAVLVLIAFIMVFSVIAYNARRPIFVNALPANRKSEFSTSRLFECISIVDDSPHCEPAGASPRFYRFNFFRRYSGNNGALDISSQSRANNARAGSNFMGVKWKTEFIWNWPRYYLCGAFESNVIGRSIALIYYDCEPLKSIEFILENRASKLNSQISAIALNQGFSSDVGADLGGLGRFRGGPRLNTEIPQRIKANTNAEKTYHDQRGLNQDGRRNQIIYIIARFAIGTWLVICGMLRRYCGHRGFTIGPMIIGGLLLFVAPWYP